jgi:hypothetical protein
VRETFACTDTYNIGSPVFYKADKFDMPLAHGKWRPSIHMPRWASRINLEITGIRVERVQDITENDAQSEGVPSYEPDDFPVAGATYGIYKDRFITLWNSINAKRGYGWDVNPWCWCIEFKKVTL